MLPGTSMTNSDMQVIQTSAVVPSGGFSWNGVTFGGTSVSLIWGSIGPIGGTILFPKIFRGIVLTLQM